MTPIVRTLAASIRTGQLTAAEYPLLAGIEKASDEDLLALASAAFEAGYDLVCIATVMSLESGFNPQARNPGPLGASGLIQFIPSTAKMLGTTIEEVRAMTFQEQIPFVIEFYRKIAPPERFKRCGDYYLAGLGCSPNTPDSTVLGREGDDSRAPCAGIRSKVWEQNSALQKDGTRTSFLQEAPGLITAGSVRRAAESRLKAGERRGLRTVRGSIPSDSRPLPEPAIDDTRRESHPGRAMLGLGVLIVGMIGIAVTR